MCKRVLGVLDGEDDLLSPVVTRLLVASPHHTHTPPNSWRTAHSCAELHVCAAMLTRPFLSVVHAGAYLYRTGLPA